MCIFKGNPLVTSRLPFFKKHRGVEQLVARQAHNLEVAAFESCLRNEQTLKRYNLALTEIENRRLLQIFIGKTVNRLLVKVGGFYFEFHISYYQKYLIVLLELILIRINLPACESGGIIYVQHQEFYYELVRKI